MNDLKLLSVTVARSNIFRANKTAEFLKKPKVVFESKNPNLRVIVRGRHLGQLHHDILDFLVLNKHPFFGKFVVGFDESQVLKALNIANGGRNQEHLREKIIEIIETTIHVQRENDEFLFNILERIEKMKNGNYIVIFNSDYLDFLERTPYFLLKKSILKKIVSQKDAVLKATIRLALSHQKYFNCSLDDLLNTFFPLKSQNSSKKRAKKAIVDFCSSSNFANLKLSKSGYLIINSN